MLVLLLLADKRTCDAMAVAREYGNYCTEEQNKIIDNLLLGIQTSDNHLVRHVKIITVNNISKHFKISRNVMLQHCIKII